MEWIDIKDFFFPEENLMAADKFDEYTLAYGVQATEVIALVKPPHEWPLNFDDKIRIRHTSLMYRRYKTADDIPDKIKEEIHDGHFVLKEHDDGTVTAFNFMSLSFNNILAYMFVDDMIQAYKG